MDEKRTSTLQRLGTGRGSRGAFPFLRCKVNPGRAYITVFDFGPENEKFPELRPRRRWTGRTTITAVVVGGPQEENTNSQGSISRGAGDQRRRQVDRRENVTVGVLGNWLVLIYVRRLRRHDRVRFGASGVFFLNFPKRARFVYIYIIIISSTNSTRHVGKNGREIFICLRFPDGRLDIFSLLVRSCCSPFNFFFLFFFSIPAVTTVIRNYAFFSPPVPRPFPFVRIL